MKGKFRNGSLMKSARLKWARTRSEIVGMTDVETEIRQQTRGHENKYIPTKQGKI